GGDEDLVSACLVVYRAHPVQLEPFPGVEGALDEIRAAGMATGLLTDGSAVVQRRKLDGLGSVAKRLDLVLLTDELGPGHAKPSPVPFRVACRILGVPPTAAVYVGNDPTKDFRGAREAGLFTVRAGRPIDFGGTVDRLSAATDDADVALDAFEHLPALLAGRMPGAGPK
ncbi:MAG: HAD family hydrolase, partial [Candidatus Limnocylindrales bacterium]